MAPLLKSDAREMIAALQKPETIEKYIVFSGLKTVLVFCYQNCSFDREKLLKFEAEGRELAKFLRSQEQFIQTVKGQNNFC